MANKLKYLLFLSFCMGLWACTEDSDIIVKKDSDFFPVQVGAFFIYDVEETKYTTLNGQEDFLYQTRLFVADSFRNTSGSTTYVVQRAVKSEDDDTFAYQDTWSVRVESSQVVLSEGNTSFIKLSFPLAIGRQWDGNALNTLGGDESCGDDTTFSCDIYEISQVGFEYEYNGDTLNETVEVLQNNNTDLIVKQDVRKEIYARNIGLMYRESTILEYCTVGSCIGQQQIEKGSIIKQRLVSHGKE